MASALGVAAMVMISGSSSAAPPGPGPSGGVGKPAGGTGPAPIPEDVVAAVRAGGAEILVTYDSSAGLAKIGAATTQRLDRSSRQAGADQAAAAYTATKSAALRHAGRGLQVRKDYDRLPFQLVTIADPAALAALAATPGVVGLATPKLSRPTAVPDDLALIRQPQAAASGFTGSGVTVAVLDTGVDPALAQGAFGDCSGGYGTSGCRIDSYVDLGGSGRADVDAEDHHGTNVASTVAATAPGAHLSIYNVFRLVSGNQVLAYDSDILSALNAITRDGPRRNIRAVNMSFGSTAFYTSDCSDSIYSTAFLNLRALGIVPVVSAGNAAMNSGRFRPGVGSPACATGAVRVGAVYANSNGGHLWGCAENPGADHIACFSQGGPLLSLLAPGVDIAGGEVTLSGTSQAAPHVAGAVAVLVSANATANAQQLVRALISTGPLVVDPRDGTQVHRLDIAAAADAISMYKSTRPEPSPVSTARRLVGRP
ncbi:S8 family serine peptidase [Dactylosporangium sp. NPDC051484]|uniref:S8 family peptidase n=1 Tax=Dactylosporangium sp. NPDC051484 TaxID=3154942 RepID=UPI00344D7C3F